MNENDFRGFAWHEIFAVGYAVSEYFNGKKYSSPELQVVRAYEALRIPVDAPEGRRLREVAFALREQIGFWD